jgi:hypothetical protein
MNFFKKKPITVTFMTTNPAAYALAPVVRGFKALPQWWRDLPPEVEYSFENNMAVANMRACTGLIDFYQSAVVLPLWTDTAVKVGPSSAPSFSYQFADRASEAHPHPDNQFQGFTNNKDYQHLKLISPWKVVSSEPLNWVMQGVPYAMDDLTEYTVLPGALNFHYSTSTNVHLMFKRDTDKDRDIRISHGTPLVMLHPMSERELDLKVLLVSHQELIAATPHDFAVTFLRKGLHNRRLVKNGVAKVTCPVGGKSL